MFREESGPVRLRLRLEEWLERLDSSDSSKMDSSSEVLREEGVLTTILGEKKLLPSREVVEPGL